MCICPICLKFGSFKEGEIDLGMSLVWSANSTLDTMICKWGSSSKQAHQTQPRLGRQALCPCNFLARAPDWCPSSRLATRGGRALYVSCKRQSAGVPDGDQASEAAAAPADTQMRTGPSKSMSSRTKSHSLSHSPLALGLAAAGMLSSQGGPFCCCPLDALQHRAARVYGRIVLAAVWLQGVEQ